MKQNHSVPGAGGMCGPLVMCHDISLHIVPTGECGYLWYLLLFSNQVIHYQYPDTVFVPVMSQTTRTNRGDEEKASSVSW